MYWFGLIGIVSIAVFVRLAFFTGVFGSDEVTYIQSAVDIAEGRWIPYFYAGSWRYGVNLPNALSIAWFGTSEIPASLWGFLCSVGEVALVFAFAFRLWGFRAALFAAVVIALLPLHVHLAGRAMADSPLAFFVSLTFVLFWIAEQKRRSALYFAAGLAAGFVFWIKESVPIFCAVFALYALLQGKWNFKWLWMALGAALMVGANCLLFWSITGDPLHIFHVIRDKADLIHTVLVNGASSPWYYFRYLFLDIKHVWIMAYLASGGMVLWAMAWLGQRSCDKATGYVVLWAIGLLVVFSLTPLSLHPLLLITKQTNYMMIFMAPLCLLAGYGLARLPRMVAGVILSIFVSGALVLGALEQQVVRVFTSNSKASVVFAQQQVDVPVYVMTNAYRVGIYASLMQPSTTQNPLRSMGRLTADLSALQKSAQAPTSKSVAIAIVDMQTIDWGNARTIKSLKDVPDCWERVGTLQPIGFGIGQTVIENLQMLVELLPNVVADKISHSTQPLLRPLPAYVYSIPRTCNFAL